MVPTECNVPKSGHIPRDMHISRSQANTSIRVSCIGPSQHERPFTHLEGQGQDAPCCRHIPCQPLRFGTHEPQHLCLGAVGNSSLKKCFQRLPAGQRPQSPEPGHKQEHTAMVRIPRKTVTTPKFSTINDLPGFTMGRVGENLSSL